MQDGKREMPIHFGVQRSRSQRNFVNTWVVFNIQLSYFIHRCRMARGRYLFILGSKGQGHNRTLSTLWFWHYDLSSFQRTAFIFHTKMQDGERKMLLHFWVKRSKVKVTTELCQHFYVQLSYLIHRYRMARHSGVEIAGWTLDQKIRVWFPAISLHVWALWWQGG